MSSFDGFECVEQSRDYEVEQGILLDLSLYDKRLKGKWVRVRRAGGMNDEWLRAYVREVRPVTSAFLGFGEYDPIKQRNAERKVWAQTVIIGWNFTRGGKEIPYTWEEGLKFIEENPDLFENHIKDKCLMAENFYVEQMIQDGEDLGNG